MSVHVIGYSCCTQYSIELFPLPSYPPDNHHFTDVVYGYSVVRNYACTQRCFDWKSLSFYFIVWASTAMFVWPKFTYYSQRCLQTLRSAVLPVLRDDVATYIHELGLHHHRRSGRARPAPVLWPAGNGTYIASTGHHPSPHLHCVYGSTSRNLTRIARHRLTQSRGRTVMFGSLYMRLLSPLKLDALLEEFRDRVLDLLLLGETRHDTDSVAIWGLWSQRFWVLDCAQLCSLRAEASLGVNQRGVAIVAAAGIRLTAIGVGFQMMTFELVTARITSGTSTCVCISSCEPCVIC